MATIKLTAKRQATFPAEVCEQLGIRSGDSLEILPMRCKGETVWLLKPPARTPSSWIGSLRKYASGKPWTREEHGDAAGRLMAAESNR
jgi:bifunctional DNA-binding transcriptional regulator/antitoxin component of YhaV-PrlF toxin-antitoxin module